MVDEDRIKDFANTDHWRNTMAPMFDSEILRLEAAMETSGDPQRTQSIVDAWILLRRMKAAIEIWKE